MNLNSKTGIVKREGNIAMKSKTLILVIAILSLLLLGAAQADEMVTFRNGIAFGDTLEDVKSKETFESVEVAEDGSRTLFGLDVIAGIADSQVAYLFDANGGLHEVRYDFRSKSDSVTGTMYKDDYETI